MVVEREREIMAFVPEEYWTLDADLQRRTREKERFRARLFKIAGKDPELHQESDVQRVLDALQGATYRYPRAKRHAPAQASAAVHHQHFAGRGGTQVTLFTSTDDAPGPTTVRRN